MYNFGTEPALNATENAVDQNAAVLGGPDSFARLTELSTSGQAHNSISTD